MKKPVIIIIAIIYILAIAVVGFLGIPARVYNPRVFVEDIQLSFDSKLTQVAVSDKDKNVDYKFRINSTTEVSFYVSAKVLPNEATEKACSFERIDKTEYFTMSTEVKGDYTTATFTCAPLPAGITTTSVYFKVRPLDGNKNLVKYVKIFVQNK